MRFFSFVPSLFIRRLSERQIWLLAWPMILANISTPLLGFVDTAVVGHLPDPSFLAGTALGSLLVTVLIWLMGFLRMSSTGLAAQAYGRGSEADLARTVFQGVVMALVIGTGLILAQNQLFSGLKSLLAQGEDMAMATAFANEYFSIRIWVAPISLINLVLIGYAIGIGATKSVLKVVLVGNLVNLLLDLLFVPVLNFGVAGVAWASVLAEMSQFVALMVMLKPISLLNHIPWQSSTNGLTSMLSMNSTLFIRSALLQGVISFMAIYASRYNANAVAMNAILMQFFLFISFAMDGIAFGLESLVGKAYGANFRRRIRLYIQRGVTMSFKFASVYFVLYWFTADWIVALLTDLPELKSMFADYYYLVVLLPFVSFLSFIFDGVFVALSWARQMQTSMAIAAGIFAVLVYAFVVVPQGSHLTLWWAFVAFLSTRWIVQLWMLKKNAWLF